MCVSSWRCAISWTPCAAVACSFREVRRLSVIETGRPLPMPWIACCTLAAEAISYQPQIGQLFMRQYLAQKLAGALGLGRLEKTSSVRLLDNAPGIHEQDAIGHFPREIGRAACRAGEQVAEGAEVV